MTLAGTRPPTVDEWEKYELHHRSRMSIKPGITGMWQASGRSDITDFEEVVKLDTEYIENWSIGLDVKILLKECNMTVLLTTHSPNFLLAVDALMRKYEIREKCHFYQTEFEENNQIKYVEKTDCLDNIYADFAASFAEMNALRKKYMNVEE